MESVEEDEPFRELIACIRSLQDCTKPCNVECHIDRIRTKLRENGAHMDASCSESADSVCWLLDSLDPWNAILYQGGLGLYEEKLGSLECRTFPLSYSEVCNDDGVVLESACLFYQLFQYHCCIQRLIIGHCYPLLEKHYWPTVLKLSLEASKGLQSIDASSGLDLDGRCSVLDAAPNVSTLQEVACAIKPSTADYLHEALRVNGCLLTKLKLRCGALTNGDPFAGLKFCSCLRELKLSSLEMNVAVFVDFMVNNKSTTRLTLSKVSSRTGSVEEGLASVLEQNTVLEVLKLSMHYGDATPIAESLRTNSTLLSLSLKHFGNVAMEALARMLTVNETLIELCLLHHFSHLDANSLVEAILSNKTLKYLRLSTSHFESVLRLVEALRLNATLCSIQLDGTMSQEERRLVGMAALQPWAVERVVTTWYGNCCRSLAHAINSGAAPTSLEVLYPMYQSPLKYDGLVELLTSLCPNRSVTTFSLTGYNPFGEFVSRKLGDLFDCNKMLEVVEISQLCLEGHEDTSHLQFICYGLARSSCIRRLRLVFTETDPSVLKLLVVVVEKNRCITALDVDIEVMIERCEADELLFTVAEWMHACRLFSNAIETNIDLLEAHLRVFANHSVIEFASDYRPVVQRNLCALNRASRFVLAPTTDKRAAEVFQAYERSPELFRVLKKTGDLDVARLVRSAANFIACCFFVVTGVVKERVECGADGKTRLQLDDLNEVCMHKIASYLRVCDVRS
ncbi:unnamed protein product [Ixodes hexagonus]